MTRTNAQGQPETITTTFTYDKLNRLTKTTLAGGSFTQVEYNEIGQQKATIDQLSRGTEFTYDEMGRQTKTNYADGKFTTTTYDAAGQVRVTKDARGNLTHYDYDDAGRRTKVKNALNQETIFTYDANGNQLTMKDALLRTTTFEYDDNNRRVKTTYHDDSFDTVAYDALGRSVSKTDQAGKLTQFFYDEIGRLTKVKDALNQQTIYGYNELGQQITQTDANNRTTRYEYDQLGRRVKRTLPGNQFETYAYDLGGNLESRTDFNGKTTTYTYDELRRLLTKAPDASLNQPTISFTYNANGQRTTMNDASGATVYSYDVRNRLASKQTLFGTLSYTYDDGGNLLTTRSSNPNGVSVDYSYDALNRLSTAKDNRQLALNGGVTAYNYDEVGNLESYQYANGVSHNYDYNALNRLTSMATATGAGTQSSYTYTLGPAGNRTAVSELGGRTVNYTYDDLYSGEQFDINLGFYYLRARYLNSFSGRFFTSDSFEWSHYDPVSLHKYLYANGDPVDQKDPSGYSVSVAEITGLVQSLAIRAAVFVLYNQTLHTIVTAFHLVAFFGDEDYRNLYLGSTPDPFTVLRNDALYLFSAARSGVTRLLALREGVKPLGYLNQAQFNNPPWNFALLFSRLELTTRVSEFVEAL